MLGLSLKNLKTNLNVLYKESGNIAKIAFITFALCSFLYDVGLYYFANYYNVKFDSLNLTKLACIQFTPVLITLMCSIKVKSVQYKNTFKHHFYTFLAFVLGYVMSYFIFSDAIEITYSYYLNVSLMLFVGIVGIFCVMFDLYKSNIWTKISLSLNRKYN